MGLGKGLLLGLIFGIGGVVASVLLPVLVSSGGGVAGIVAVIVAFTVVIVLGIYVACGYAVTTQVVVLAFWMGLRFLRPVVELTRGFRGKVFGIALIAGIIFYAPIAALGGAVGAMRVSDPQTSAILAVVGALVPVVLTPLLACVFTLMYYDLRIRREGFDLQVLSQQLVSS